VRGSLCPTGTAILSAVHFDERESSVLKIVISIDVEEEGLFSGRYPRIAEGVENVRALRRLEFITAEFGFRLTLLATYPVAASPDCRRVLHRWREQFGAEIGAHLHPWNTPPFQGHDDEKCARPEQITTETSIGLARICHDDGSHTRSEQISAEESIRVAPICHDDEGYTRPGQIPRFLIEAKLGSLVKRLKDNLGVSPRAFRMGRFDLAEPVRALLPEYGLTVDSSIVPLRSVSGGPDHFLAAVDPFYLPPVGSNVVDSSPMARTQSSRKHGAGHHVRDGWGETPPITPGAMALPVGEECGEGGERAVLEVPLTVVPILRNSPWPVYRFAAGLPGPGRDTVLKGFRYFGVAGIHPAWFSLQSMKLAARLHRLRGGKVLNMFLHSSELQPGATPAFRTENAVGALVEKIRSFLTWLVRTVPVEGATLSDLYPAGTGAGRDSAVS